MTVPIPPYLESKGEARYFVAAPDGIRYRVYDTITQNGKPIAVKLMSRLATSRIFRPQEGHWRVYRFRAESKRTLEVMNLQSQLQQAEFLAREKFDAAAHHPR